ELWLRSVPRNADIHRGSRCAPGIPDCARRAGPRSSICGAFPCFASATTAASSTELCLTRSNACSIYSCLITRPAHDAAVVSEVRASGVKADVFSECDTYRSLAVPSGSILMSTGCYLVQTDDRRNILIDSGMPVDADGSDPPTEESAGILAQLRELGVRPEDVEVVICTHFDIDHVGHHEHFINAEHIVQREQYEVAVSGAERFAGGRSHWDAPGTQRRLVDGDVELMPGLRLVETSGDA